MKRTKVRGLTDRQLAEILDGYRTVLNQHAMVINQLTVRVNALLKVAGMVAEPEPEPDAVSASEVTP